MTNTKNVLRFILIFQYLPRLFLIFPLSTQIIKATGVVTKTAWAGAAYNLMLYMLASHVSKLENSKLSHQKIIMSVTKLLNNIPSFLLKKFNQVAIKFEFV